MNQSHEHGIPFIWFLVRLADCNFINLQLLFNYSYFAIGDVTIIPIFGREKLKRRFGEHDDHELWGRWIRIKSQNYINHRLWK